MLVRASARRGARHGEDVWGKDIDTIGRVKDYAQRLKQLPDEDYKLIRAELTKTLDAVP